MLGIYYLTKAKSGARGEGRAFGNADDVMLALEAGELETLSPIPASLHRRSCRISPPRATTRTCSAPRSRTSPTRFVNTTLSGA